MKNAPALVAVALLGAIAAVWLSLAIRSAPSAVDQWDLYRAAAERSLEPDVPFKETTVGKVWIVAAFVVCVACGAFSKEIRTVLRFIEERGMNEQTQAKMPALAIVGDNADRLETLDRIIREDPLPEDVVASFAPLAERAPALTSDAILKAFEHSAHQVEEAAEQLMRMATEQVAAAKEIAETLREMGAEEAAKVHRAAQLAKDIAAELRARKQQLCQFRSTGEVAA